TKEGQQLYAPVLAHLSTISSKNNPSQSRTLPSSAKIFRCLAPKTRYSRVAPYFKLVEVLSPKRVPVILRTAHLTLNHPSKARYYPTLSSQSFGMDRTITVLPQKSQRGFSRSQEPSDQTKVWIFEKIVRL